MKIADLIFFHQKFPFHLEMFRKHLIKDKWD